MEDSNILQYIRSVKQNPENIKMISKEILIEYPQICFEAIKKDSEGIKYIPLDIREKIPQLCIDAVKANPKNIKYVPEQVQIENPQMCIDAIKQAEGLLYYISIDLLEEHPEICLEALLRDSECVEDIPEEIIESNPQIQAMLDIMNDWKTIEKLPEDMLRNNPQLCIRAALSSKGKYRPTEELLLNNSELVEKFIKEWHLNGRAAIEFVIATKDKEYIRNSLKNKEQYFGQYVLSHDYFRLMRAMGDNIQETIQQILEQKEEYNLTNSEIVPIIIETGDTEFIKRMIDKREQYGFSSSDLVFLIRNTKEAKFIEQCINQSQLYGLGEKKVDTLIESTMDIPFIINYVRENANKNAEIMKRIKLPKGMTIGMEIESEGDASEALLCDEEILEGWTLEQDKSLENGVEVVSPVLKSEDGREKEIYDICSILRLCGNYISYRCGGHIHIGADYLKNIDAWKNLIEIWSNTENILYIISNAEGDIPRSEVFEYAAPISQNIEKFIENGEVDLENEDDVEELCKKLQHLQGRDLDSRYSGINFENFGNESKNTIEFRLSNGTIDPETWIENINLFGGIIAVSQELADIQEKIENGIETTEEEQAKLDAFERIKEIEINEEEKLKCLLTLAIDSKDQHVYFNRYYTNSKEMFYRKIVYDVKPIRINKKKLGKIAFTGEQRVTGEDYEQASGIIQSVLDKEILNHVISE